MSDSDEVVWEKIRAAWGLYIERMQEKSREIEQHKNTTSAQDRRIREQEQQIREQEQQIRELTQSVAAKDEKLKNLKQKNEIGERRITQLKRTLKSYVTSFHEETEAIRNIIDRSDRLSQELALERQRLKCDPQQDFRSLKTIKDDIQQPAA